MALQPKKEAVMERREREREIGKVRNNKQWTINTLTFV